MRRIAKRSVKVELEPEYSQSVSIQEAIDDVLLEALDQLSEPRELLDVFITVRFDQNSEGAISSTVTIGEKRR